MRLQAWQNLKNLSNRQLSELVKAKGVKCHETMICHYYAGRKCFSPSVAAAIEELAEGKVTLREILFPSGQGSTGK